MPRAEKSEVFQLHVFHIRPYSSALELVRSGVRNGAYGTHIVERLFSQVGIAFSSRHKSAQAQTLADIVFTKQNVA